MGTEIYSIMQVTEVLITPSSSHSNCWLKLKGREEQPPTSFPLLLAHTQTFLSSLLPALLLV